MWAKLRVIGSAPKTGEVTNHKHVPMIKEPNDILFITLLLSE